MLAHTMQMEDQKLAKMVVQLIIGQNTIGNACDHKKTLTKFYRNINDRSVNPLKS